MRRPGVVTADQLAHLPPHTASVEFTSGKGTERRTEAGVLLSDLLPPDALATSGAIPPDFATRGRLRAPTAAGTALPRPRLGAPGDRRGGRYVSDVVELHVIRATG